jgi:endo-1,4-beta-D-glucanase Y
VRRVAALAVAVGALAVVLYVVARGGEEPAGDPRTAAVRFLDDYVEADGRVVRHDQGGDTVSEGQAYAMLLAAAIGDRRRFDLAWRWTREHLLRPDGLLAWHWDDGAVVDAEPAADADLDAARALLVAARRFREPAYAEEGRRLGEAIRAHMVVNDLLYAGPWARDERVVNPSYLSPRAFEALGWDGSLTRTRGVLGALGEPLPPDWVRVEGDTVTPTGPPGSDGDAVFSYDAARVPLRLAESCFAEDRELAARSWPALRDRDPLPAVLGLDGAGRTDETSPMALTGAAGAAFAAGDRGAATDLLDRAAQHDAEHPSYYGAAWVALARVMLETDWLGACGGAQST